MNPEDDPAFEISHEDHELAKLESAFMEAFDDYSRYVHAKMKQNGFWPKAGRSFKELLLLLHTEISEAAEGLRHGNQPSEHIPAYNAIEEELADLVIRVMDTGEGKELRLAQAIVVKMRFNQTREHKHGKEF